MNELMTVISSVNEICDFSNNILSKCRRHSIIAKADLEILSYKLDNCIANAETAFEISQYTLKKTRNKEKMMCRKEIFINNMKVVKEMYSYANDPNLSFEEREFALQQIHIISQNAMQELESF